MDFDFRLKASWLFFGLGLMNFILATVFLLQDSNISSSSLFLYFGGFLFILAGYIKRKKEKQP